MMGAGQFCTKPGIAVAIGPNGASFVEAAAGMLGAASPGTLFSSNGVQRLASGVEDAVEAGARLATGGHPKGPGFGFEPTLLDVDADQPLGWY